MTTVFIPFLILYIMHIMLGFHIEKIRARDLWHQLGRFWRKVFAHTVCIKICTDRGGEPLQFEHLLSC